MRKTKGETPVPEPEKQVRPVPVSKQETEKSPDAAVLPSSSFSPTDTPAPSNIPEPAKQPVGGSPKSRREARALSRAPEVPFKELDSRAREVYTQVLNHAGAFLKSVDQPYTEKYESSLAICGLIIETLKTSGVLLSYTSYSTAEDYLRSHTANTTIMALALGLEAGLPDPGLQLLGFCAMAHDIGMTEYSSLYNRADRLGKNEFSEMSLHAEAGVAKLDRILDLDYRIKERAKRIVLQTHERADGSGYPDRLSDEEMDPLAQFISIADAYEAMTHPRAWRDAMNPPEAVKELVETEGRGFNARAVKALLSAVSIYPPGSLVALSSGEIARVIRVTRGFLSKPLVEILLDSGFSQLNPRLADLFEHPLVSIERSVGFDEIEDRNPRYAARLEMARWWVEW
ncbi:MAG: HD domain-containing phosphohydrolase [Elusimicrobiota bacterium]